MFGLFAPAAQRCTTPARTTEAERPHRQTAPPCDIHETGTAVVLTADMPGVAQDGVEVRIHGDLLTLSGRSAVSEPDRLAPLWREYAPRDYVRTFRLGQDIDPERVSASIKDGVLRVELQKRAGSQPRRIQVSAG